MKKCTNCCLEKPFSEFHVRKTARDGHRSHCKQCEREKCQEYKNNNRQKLREYDKKRYYDNHEKLKQKSRDYMRLHKEERRQYSRAYFQNHKDKIRESRRLYLQQYRRDNPEIFKKIRRKRLQNPVNRIRKNLSTRLQQSLRGNPKLSTTMKLVGCSIQQLKEHLSSQFQAGMSWKNYGINGWHVDHIKPCFMFDLSTLQGQQECFHYTNLRPLWWRDNIMRNYEEFNATHQI